MEEMLTVNKKIRANRHLKSKKKLPLKVVYITNPIRFNISASEFRALVQEHTGQDADTAETSRFSVSGGGGGEAADAVKGINVDHAVEEEVTKIGHRNNGEVMGQERSDPSGIGSYNDVFVSPQMMESFPCQGGSNLLDVLKGLDAM